MDNIIPNETDPYDIFLLTVINCVERQSIIKQKGA